jgi:pimeloyl-ACP methyl ester carboxylesterase
MLIEKRFDAGAVELNYVEGPNAGPPLLFLHGITNCWQRYLLALPPLMLQWRVMAVDLRGHGRSGHVKDGYGLMAYVHDLIRMLSQLDDEPAAVVGHSLGAMIAIGLASEAPSLVSAVVLEDPPLGAFDGTPFDTRPERPRFVAQRDTLRGRPTAAELVEVIRPHNPSVDEVTLRLRAARLLRIDPEVLTPVIESAAIENYDLDDRLRQIAAPTLLLQGNPELGGALSDAEAARAASLIPDCIHVSIPEVGHDMLTTSGPQTGRYLELVTRFLEPVRAAAR